MKTLLIIYFTIATIWEYIKEKIFNIKNKNYD